MGMKVSGTFIMDNGVASNIDIGFIPDYVKMISNLEGGSNEIIFEWWRALADLGDSGVSTYGRYGISNNGGAITVPSTAATGIIPYTGRKQPQVMVESPIPETGDLAVPCFNFAYHKAASTTPVARSATVIGTMCRPNTANGYVYECTTSGGAMTALTEPTWPTSPGDTVSDGSNTWTCREENIALTGGMGFTVGATLNVDGDQCVFTAEQHDKYGYMGDSAGQDPVKFPLR